MNTLCLWFNCQSEDLGDEWTRQYNQKELNPMYNYVNLQGRGLLIDAAGNKSKRKLTKLIKELKNEENDYFHLETDSHIVTKVEWQQYLNHLMDDKMQQDAKLSKVELPNLENLSFQDHPCFWKLSKRGEVGETLLHICVLLNSRKHKRITKKLLKRYPRMVDDIYESPEYYGESALHLAIVNGDLNMVKLLVQNGANVNQRATGRFFLPEDQKKTRTSNTNYDGYAYYGEYPLAFASCFGHEEIYDYLILKGADPNAPDSFGNTVLHMMVITNQIRMFKLAVNHHLKKANMQCENKKKLTPLTLASMLGRNEMFKEIIELQSIEIWRYSNITCSKYPLAPLDTIGPDGKINWSSALIYITDGETAEHLAMLEGGVIKELLDNKWKTYAKRRFFERFVMAVLHLLLLSVAVYLRPDVSGVNKQFDTSPSEVIRYVAELIVCINCLINLIFQLGEIRSQGWLGFLKNQTSAPAKLIFNISCILILLCVPCRIIGSGGEIILLAIATPCAWTFMLFFARGASLFGPFVVMIYKMCASDLVRFVVIFVVFLIQFSQAFYFLFKDSGITDFATAPGTMMTLIQMTFGNTQYSDFTSCRNPLLAKFILIFFGLLSPILLLNMLIAMMGDTFSKISTRSEKEWKRQWAMIIMILERSFSRKDLLRFQQEYSVPMDTEENRGLMVIKTSLKTKARQKKGALLNWRRCFAVVKADIQERKATIAVPTSAVRKLSTRQPPVLDTLGLASGITQITQQLAWEKDLDIDLNNSIILRKSVDKHNSKDNQRSALFNNKTHPINGSSSETSKTKVKVKSKTSSVQSGSAGSTDSRPTPAAPIYVIPSDSQTSLQSANSLTSLLITNERSHKGKKRHESEV